MWCHKVTELKAGLRMRRSGAVFSVGERSIYWCGLNFFFSMHKDFWNTLKERRKKSKKNHNRSPTLCSNITFLLNRPLGSACWNIFLLSKDIRFTARRSLGNSIIFLKIFLFETRPSKSNTYSMLHLLYTHSSTSTSCLWSTAACCSSKFAVTFFIN